MAGLLMSEEGKFRFNVSLNFAILLALIGGAFGLWTTIVQKYDQVDSKMGMMQETINKMEQKQSAVDALEKRVEEQGQHILADESRQTGVESKVDALTSLLNEFMGTFRSSVHPNPAPTPMPAPDPSH